MKRYTGTLAQYLEQCKRAEERMTVLVREAIENAPPGYKVIVVGDEIIYEKEKEHGQQEN